MHKILRFIASLKLAIYLLAAMAGLYAVAALRGDMNIYSSWMFRLLLAAFWLNLFTCTLTHLPGVWRLMTKKARLDMTSSGFEDLPAAGVSRDEIAAVLKKLGFKAESLANDEGEIIFAQKAKAGLLAPQLLHIAILVILIGAFLTSLGVSGAVICTNGQKVDLPGAVAEKVGDGYDIYVEDFRTVYDQEGAVENWVTTLQLRENGEVVQSGTASVNHPLQYKGMSIYQNSYKYQYLVALNGVSPEVDGVYSLPEDLQVSINDDFYLAAHGMSEDEILIYTVYKGKEVTYALGLGETMLFEDGITIEYGGENNYTILQVKYAPGTKVVFLGFFLAVIASMLFWCGRYQEIYLRRKKGGDWQWKIHCKSPEIVQKLKKDFAQKL